MDEHEEDSTWKEMQRYVTQDGYREGAALGSKKSFQTGFDEGYALGFRFGTLLGHARGMSAVKNVNSGESTVNLNVHTEVNCKICDESSDPKKKSALPDLVYQNSYSELKSTQIAHNKHSEDELRKTIPELPIER